MPDGDHAFIEAWGLSFGASCEEQQRSTVRIGHVLRDGDHDHYFDDNPRDYAATPTGSEHPDAAASAF